MSASRKFTQSELIIAFEESGYIAEIDKDDGEIVSAKKTLATSGKIDCNIHVISNVFNYRESCILFKFKIEDPNNSTSLQFSVESQKDINLVEGIVNLVSLSLVLNKPDSYISKYEIAANDITIRYGKESIYKIFLRIFFEEKRIHAYHIGFSSKIIKSKIFTFKNIRNEDPIILFRELIPTVK